MNNQFCTKPNVHMYLTWLLVSLFHSVFFGSSYVTYGSLKKTSGPKTRASFLSVRSALLRFLIAARLRLVPSKQSNCSCSVSHDGFSTLRFRSILPASTSAPHQFKAGRKNQTASHPAIHPLIKIFHICITNIKSTIHQQLVIKEIGITRRLKMMVGFHLIDRSDFCSRNIKSKKAAADQEPIGA
ncbi:hypothetical protein ABWW58_09280 [Sporolactobacillus sp. STCC-11]|uniref:hypothetical protein n=1 Tax=Sporolactobacillus caesalpiniae TaxID=3230362 RepID=UPI003398FB46